jgi:nicotinate phosphoribosyltransferase
MPKKSLYKQSLALLTDLYQLTMCYGYWKSGFTSHESIFHLYFRKNPFLGGFTVAAGLESAIVFLENFHFDESDLSYLSTLKGPGEKLFFSHDFLEYLANMKFQCSIDAVPEGTTVFPQEPLLRIQGPLIQCQILESPLLNLLNFPTLIATKAGRICIAAKGDSVFEFGLRRAQRLDGALTASRSAYIGGCDATSNLLAGKLFDIPVKGTHSHSWVMVFDEELEAFQAYARALPDNCIFLVDTYDTINGIKNAIKVGEWLRSQGKKLLGVRLDSGDLAYLSIQARKMLDETGFPDAKIVASNELDETIISDLKRQGAKIDIWGVGTNLVTAKDQPSLDGVYKLSAIREKDEPWKYKLKLSEQMLKISNPGILQVRRYVSNHENVADVIYDIHTDISTECTIVDPLDPTKQKVLKKGLESHDLLVPIFREGQLVYQSPTLEQIRSKTKSELNRFHDGIKRFINPHQYIVGMEKSLYDKKDSMIREIRKKAFHPFLMPREE